MSIKPRCRVRIIEDCRKEKESAKGMLGIYEGDFNLPDGEFDNPRILLDNGDIIWGIECWWEEYKENKSMKKSEQEVREFINEYKKIMN